MITATFLHEIFIFKPQEHFRTLKDISNNHFSLFIPLFPDLAQIHFYHINFKTNYCYTKKF